MVIEQITLVPPHSIKTDDAGWERKFLVILMFLNWSKLRPSIRFIGIFPLEDKKSAGSQSILQHLDHCMELLGSPSDSVSTIPVHRFRKPAKKLFIKDKFRLYTLRRNIQGTEQLLFEDFFDQ